MGPTRGMQVMQLAVEALRYNGARSRRDSCAAQWVEHHLAGQASPAELRAALAALAAIGCVGVVGNGARYWIDADDEEAR